MNRSKRITSLLLAFLAAAATAASASGQAPDWVLHAPGAKEYPNDDGLLLKQIVRITLDETGKVERSEESALKMLTDYVDRHNHFDPSIHWNNARADLRIDRAMAYRADHTPVEAKENSLVENTAPEMQWAVPYAHMRAMTVAHVGVEHDATAVLAYTVTDREPSGVPLWGEIDLESFLPVLDQEVSIAVPNGVTLRYACSGCALEPEITREGRRVSYAFRRSRVPSVNTEEIPGGRYGLDRLVYSVAEDWAAVARYLEGRVEAAIVTGGPVRAQTDVIVGEATLPMEKLSRIHEFVIDGVRSVHWPIADFDYAARPAGEVLESSVGHPLDKAVLLASMLRCAGFEAHVALASEDPEIARDVPSPVQLEEAWVRVKMAGGERWLDPDAGRDHRNEYHLLGRPRLVLDGSGAGIETAPQAAAAQNRAALRAEVAIEDGGHELLLSGFADVDLAMRTNPLVAYDRSENRQAGLAKQVAGAFGGASVEATHVGRESCGLTSLRTEFSGGAVEVPLHGLVRVALPRVPGGLSGGAVQVERERRTVPFLVPGGPASERVHLELTLPDGYELVYAPEDASIECAAGSVTRRVKRDGKTLTITTELTVKAEVIAPAEWPAFRAMIATLEGDRAETILLQREE